MVDVIEDEVNGAKWDGAGGERTGGLSTMAPKTEMLLPPWKADGWGQ